MASRSFKNLLPVWLATQLMGAQPLISFVTVGELMQWTRLRHWGARNVAMLDLWLSDKPVIPGGKRVAEMWGELSAAATQRGRPRPVNDTWVAASCLAYHLPLATFNVKDYADFAEHHDLVIYSQNGGRAQPPR